jgi:hypothetical protein
VYTYERENTFFLQQYIHEHPQLLFITPTTTQKQSMSISLTLYYISSIFHPSRQSIKLIHGAVILEKLITISFSRISKPVDYNQLALKISSLNTLWGLPHIQE